MTLAKRIEQLLKDELKPENIKTVIDIAEYFKFNENKSIWDKLKESQEEYITDEERKHIEELKAKSEF